MDKETQQKHRIERLQKENRRLAQEIQKLHKKLEEDDINTILEHIKKHDDELDKLMRYVLEEAGVCVVLDLTRKLEDQYGIARGSKAWSIMAYLEVLKDKAANSEI